MKLLTTNTFIRLTHHSQYWVHASFQKENRIEWMTNAIDACLSFAFLRCCFFTPQCASFSHLNDIFHSNGICSCHKTDLVSLNKSECQCHSHISSACCVSKIVWFHLQYGKEKNCFFKAKLRYVKDDYNIRSKSNQWKQKRKYIYLILCQTNGNNNRRQWNENGDTIRIVPKHTQIFTSTHIWNRIFYLIGSAWCFYPSLPKSLFSKRNVQDALGLCFTHVMV